jgi:outer membrane receptor protein involved in Fe transport
MTKQPKSPGGRLGVASYVALALLAAGHSDRAHAQEDSQTPQKPPPGATPPAQTNEAGLAEVTVTAQRMSLLGTATTASEGVVVNDELALTPAFRPGQLLETVPGLTVTSHSGEGKANQYLMRGYNLDHGTDLAVFVDGMPVNEPTHAHGQGYSDLNFMVPELATNISYTKGTYYADEGDFASVGSVHISYLDVIPDQIAVTAGTASFQHLFSAGSVPLAGGNLLGALEIQHYDGPWDPGTDQRKYNLVLRYSSGDEHDGYSITGMLYHDMWNAITDQPERAIAEGLIGRFGSLDPSDGGQAQRASLSAQWHATVGGGVLSANTYVIGNHLTLWNDFTHYLVDPINGDQEGQHEDRTTLGGDISYARTAAVAGINHDLLFGLHSRYDYNDVSRAPTADRIPLTDAQLEAVDYPSSFIEQDQVRLSSIAGYAQITSHWTDWFRSVIGLREDYMYGNDTGTNYGTASSALAEPKATLIFRPLETTEVYASWGRGFHSDDLRGVNQAKIQGLPGAPLIASQTGEELGLRQQFLQNITATVALYNLNAQSETTYDPDVGQDSAGPASRRRGVEINLTYQALRWLEFYASYSANHARYTTPYDDGTGHVGYYLPNAPFAAGSFNVYVKNLGRWDAGLEYRYLSAFPLSSDDEVQGHGYGEWNGDVHYSFDGGWKLGLGVFNILNVKADAAEFWYTDRLPGEPAAGVNDLHVHPLEPISARFTIAKTFF